MCNNSSDYAGDDEEIAKAAYNTYVGRGFIHLTWKENYQSNYNYLVMAGLTPKDFITDAKHLSDDVETAAMSACGFFKQKGCLSYADNDSFDGVKNKVNKYDTNKSKKKLLLSTVKAQILTLE